MKKLLTFIIACSLICIACFNFSACKQEKTVKEGDTLVIGVTDYKPMDYLENGEWVGFDAELAKKVFNQLGYNVEFKEIDWETKIVTLNAGTIDVIWNGMTVTDELLSNLLLTNSYLVNRQVIVIDATKADTVNKLEDLAGKVIAVEGGSAAQSAVEDKNAKDVRKLINQNAAVTDVFGNQSDLAVVDYSLAKKLTAEGTSYYGKLVMKDIGFTPEYFAAAVRKSDSALLWGINEKLAEYKMDGTIKQLAEKYGIENQLTEDVR